MHTEKELHELLFYQSPLANFVFTDQGEVLFISPSFYALLEKELHPDMSLCDITKHTEPSFNFLDIFSNPKSSATVFLLKNQNYQLLTYAITQNLAQAFFIPLTDSKELRDTINHASYSELIYSMVNVQKAKDVYTVSHQNRVAVVATAIAHNVNLPEHAIKGIELAAHVHDIGKIGIPSELLTKQIPLTKLEFELMKTHTTIGYEILKENNFPWPIAEIVLQHHEHIDGSGYPQKLSGDEIRQEAKIIAVADALDAMAAPRPYRPARSIEYTLDELLKYRSIFFEPEIVDICIELVTSQELSIYNY